MAIEVFNRYEKKYLINTNIYGKMRDRLLDYMELDKYNKKHETYSISNIYYDTDDDYLIRTSISKPKYKEKLRMRAYGTPDLSSQVYVEIKKKFYGSGNKRRSALCLEEAYVFLHDAKIPDIKQYMNQQVLREIQYILESYELKPKVYLAYERRAYFGDGKHDLRISFDTAITTRRYDLRLESGIYGESLLKPEEWIMEIKVANSMPVWLTHLLSEYKIYPLSFSKYGTEYKGSLTQSPSYENMIYMSTPIYSNRIVSA